MTKGRLEAFDDAIHKLLWPERRLLSSSYNGATPERLKQDHGLIWRTPTDTYLIIPGKHVPSFARRLPWPSKLEGLARWLEKLGSWKIAPAAALLILSFVSLGLSTGAQRVARWWRVAAHLAM